MFSCLYFPPKRSKSLFRIEKTKSVSVSSSSVVTTILSMHHFSISLVLWVTLFTVRVRYTRLWCSAKEMHLSLECHQTLGDLDSTVSFSRFEMSEMFFNVLQSQNSPKSPVIQWKQMSAVNTQGQMCIQLQKTNPNLWITPFFFLLCNQNSVQLSYLKDGMACRGTWTNSREVDSWESHEI